ncbi:MAG: hypothetical protein Q8O14_02050 [bacterium]|nr:hypothetical protein [bacterium]
MNKLLMTSLLALGLMATSALALRDLSLKQQGELPRDQYVDLVDPDHVHLDKLVVKFVEDTRVRLRDGRLVSLEGWRTDALEAFLKARPHLSVERLFSSVGEEELEAYIARGEQLSGYDVADLNNWYLFRVDDRRVDAKGLLLDLLQLDLVQTGYYEPKGEPAVCGTDPAPTTPNYVGSQGYRGAAPTGVDIQYAWDYNPTYGNGISSYWFQDMEVGWCEDHEDFASTFTIRNPPDSDVPDYYNHGTAVMGIVGACDDGKGVTGLVPDVRLTARTVLNHSSYADALIAIGNDLVTGETYLIELHAQGPDQGTTCVCNCAQFRYIAIEYWQGNFDAILANSANGRYCVEAAGNGSMDLDWAGYSGAFNRSFRDSQAIIVGAGTSGSVHNPECWTNHGTRIDAYGWGSNVVTTGYGTLFNQADCQQDYASGFAGTSSASPIVAGPAVSLALIHNAQFGSYPAPLTLRSRLQTNGTPQGPVDTWKELSVQPNMKGILAPDLLPYTPVDWSASVVPSNVTGTNTVSANLPPAPAATYIDLCFLNQSRYGSVASALSRLYRDDVFIGSATATNLGPFTSAAANDFSQTIRGGLHYLKLVCDPLSAVDESVETNNTEVLAYCWDPAILAINSPQTFTRGPKKNPEGYSSFALDGYRMSTTGWWRVFGVMPASSAGDYDLRLYNTAPTSTTGWTSHVSSSLHSSATDFVGSNGNLVSDGIHAGVVNHNDTSDSYTVESDISSYLGSVPASQALVGNYSLDAGEILDAFEMNCTAGSPVWLNFQVTDGAADLAVLVYGPGTTYFSRDSALWALNAGGAGASEMGIFTPAESGFHGIVVCKNLRSDLANQVSYDFYWGPPAGDLVTVARASWTAPVVARNSGGTVGALPAVLNEGPSLGDAGVANIGLGSVPAGANLAITLDGVTVYTSGNFASLAPGYEGEVANRSIGAVKGGRHELGAIQDVNSEVAEQLPDGEANNRHYRQYAWAPHPLTFGVQESRTAAPNYVNPQNPDYWSQPGPNQDGYLLSTAFWTAVAAMPTHAEGYLPTYIYANADTNPISAYLYPVATNYPPYGGISLVAANGNVLGNVVQRNVGVSNGWAYPTHSTQPYTVQMAHWMDDLEAGHVYPGTLAAGAGGGQLLHMRDMHLFAGESVSLRLFNNSTVDLGLAIFQAGLGYATLDNAAAVFNGAGVGVDESGAFTATVTGWHGVAVYRSGYQDLGPAAPYSLVMGTRRPVAITDLELIPVELDASDGYYLFTLQFGDVTQDVNGDPLVVDYYRFWWSFDPYAEFPNGWVNWDNWPVSELVNFLSTTGGATGIYFLVTAVDNNGVLLATSHPDLVGAADAEAVRRAPLAGGIPGQSLGAGEAVDRPLP